MDRTNPHDAAFSRPASTDTELGSLVDGDVVVAAAKGLTKREWFAGQALRGGFAGVDAVKAADDVIRALSMIEPL